MLQSERGSRRDEERRGEERTYRQQRGEAELRRESSSSLRQARWQAAGDECGSTLWLTFRMMNLTVSHSVQPGRVNRVTRGAMA